MKQTAFSLSILLAAAAALSTLLLGASPAAAFDEEEYGRRFHEEISKKYRVYEDPRLTEIGRRVSEVAQVRGVKFYALDMGKDEQLNAFQVPGHIYATKSLLKEFDDISLTFIMGHELGHESGRHLSRQVRRNQTAGIAAVLLGAIFGVKSNTVGDYAINLAGLAYINQYSQEQEREADLFGLNVLYDLGIPFEKAAEAFKKLGGDRKESRTLNAVFGSHPMMRERIQRTGSASEWLTMRPVDIYEGNGRRIAVLWRYTGDDPMGENEKRLRAELRREMTARGYTYRDPGSPRVWTALSRAEKLDAVGLRALGDALGAQWLMIQSGLDSRRGWSGQVVGLERMVRVPVAWKFRQPGEIVDFFQVSIENISSGRHDDLKVS